MNDLSEIHMDRHRAVAWPDPCSPRKARERFDVGARKPSSGYSCSAPTIQERLPRRLIARIPPSTRPCIRRTPQSSTRSRRTASADTAAAVGSRTTRRRANSTRAGKICPCAPGVHARQGRHGRYECSYTADPSSLPEGHRPPLRAPEHRNRVPRPSTRPPQPLHRHPDTSPTV